MHICTCTKIVVILWIFIKFRFDKSDDDDDNFRLPLFEEESIQLSNMRSYGGLNSVGTRRNGKSLGQKLKIRCDLMKRRRLMVDIICGLALLGIVLMMIETELFIYQYTDKTDLLSQMLKICMSISTVFLLLCICYSYYIDLQIRALEAGVKDWTSVIKNSTVLCLFLELIICSLHPFPGAMNIQYTSPGGQPKIVSIDAALSILMLTRLYLIAKFAVVHSRLLTDTSTNSIGALSKIKINSLFVLKAVMVRSPSALLLAVMVTTFLVNSWAMRACEIYYHEDPYANSYLEVMWLIATTFLTVGYGDKIPQSYCGRYISVVTGIMGVLTTALLVAIVARQLEQTRPERYVFNMVTRIQIEKQKKTAAANVIKAKIRLWILKKYGAEHDAPKLRREFEDQLIASIKQLRAAKVEMAHVGEFNVGIIEVSEAVNRISDAIDGIAERQGMVENRAETNGQRLWNIEAKLEEIKTLMPIQK